MGTRIKGFKVHKVIQTFSKLTFLRFCKARIILEQKNNLLSYNFLSLGHSVKHWCIEPSVERELHKLLVRDIHDCLYCFDKVDSLTVWSMAFQSAQSNVETYNADT